MLILFPPKISNHLFLFIFILSFSFSIFGQSKDTISIRNENDKTIEGNRFFTGGNIGLQFGTITLIEISPIIGYRITNNISAGLGLSYKYYRYKDQYQNFNTNIQGIQLFCRYFINENIFTHLEYELLNFDSNLIFGQSTNGRIYNTSIFAGGGLKQEISQDAFLFLLALYDINESSTSLYKNPSIRGGIIFGI